MTTHFATLTGISHMMQPHQNAEEEKKTATPLQVMFQSDKQNITFKQETWQRVQIGFPERKDTSYASAVMFSDKQNTTLNRKLGKEFKFGSPKEKNTPTPQQFFLRQTKHDFKQETWQRVQVLFWTLASCRRESKARALRRSRNWASLNEAR